MKKLNYLISLLTLGIFLIFLYGGCDKSLDPVTTSTTSSSSTTSIRFLLGTISGRASLPPILFGDVTGTRVALYLNVDDWENDRSFQFTACDGSGNYTISGVIPGAYYMDAWKDNDNDGNWGTSGDYVWVNGSLGFPNYTLDPIQFPAGWTAVNFELLVVP